MVNSEELIGTTEYLTLQTMCRLNRCRYNRVRLYLSSTQEDKETKKESLQLSNDYIIGFMFTAFYKPEQCDHV